MGIRESKACHLCGDPILRLRNSISILNSARWFCSHDCYCEQEGIQTEEEFRLEAAERRLLTMEKKRKEKWAKVLEERARKQLGPCVSPLDMKE